VLVDAAPKIPPEIPTRLGDYAAAHLSKRRVEIHVSTRLDSADDHGALLSDGMRIETATLVWTAGVAPSPDLGLLGLPSTTGDAFPSTSI
jgi:NADH dehydrogenase